MKFFIWGLGSIGTSFLRIIKDNGYFDSECFYCLDSSLEAKDRFLSFGGKENHFCLDRITEDNIGNYLNMLTDGNYLLDFTIDLKTLDILRYCLEHNIHYLNTADSSWKNDPLWISVHQHYLEYLKIKEEFTKRQNTCLVEFGMNPGMVSCFVKRCIKEIVKTDNSLYVKMHRKELMRLLDEGKYGLVAKKLKVTDVQEVDDDDQEVSISFENGVCYSPWNVWGYYYETISSPEIACGTRNRFYAYKEIYDCDFDDLYVAPKESGYKYKAETISPQGKIRGHISCHEEIFTIRKMLTYKNYRPTVHFVYSPSDYAIRSMDEEITREHLIKRDEIIKGGESVGVIIQGKRFHSHYYGNYLDTMDLDESATVLQVSASSYAGFVYMIRHEKDGLLFPEDVNEEEVLEIAKPYLKEYLSFRCPKISMTLGKDIV